MMRQLLFILLLVFSVATLKVDLYGLVIYKWVNKVQQTISKNSSPNNIKSEDSTSDQNYKCTTLPTIFGLLSLEMSTISPLSSKRIDIFPKYNQLSKLQALTLLIGLMIKQEVPGPLWIIKAKNSFIFLKEDTFIWIRRKIPWLFLGGKINNFVLEA